MLSHTVLFDLDGTLTDPKPGITRGIQYAISELGYKPPDANELLWCIGPPLKSSFSQLLQTADDTLLEAAILQEHPVSVKLSPSTSSGTMSLDLRYKRLMQFDKLTDHGFNRIESFFL